MDTHLKVSSFFTNKIGAPYGDVVGLINPLLNLWLSKFYWRHMISGLEMGWAQKYVQSQNQSLLKR